MAVDTGVVICGKCRRLNGWVVGWWRSRNRRLMALTMEVGAAVEAFHRGRLRLRLRRIWILKMRVMLGRTGS